MKSRLILQALTASLLLAACAQTERRQDALKAQPLQEVRHGADPAKAQYALGRYYHGQLRYELAIEAYRRALALNAESVEALNALGMAYAETGDFMAARTQFEAALERRPDVAYLHNNLGYANDLAGDHVAAVASYAQALRLDGQHVRARENLGLAADKMRQSAPVAVEAALAPLRVEDAAAWVKISPAIYEMRLPQTAPTVAASEDVVAPALPSPAGAQAVPSAPVVGIQPVSLQGAPVPGLEISNGNGVRGMAANVARYFSWQGISAARLTNQKPFIERHTRIEYRTGRVQEAVKLNALLPTPARLVTTDRLRQGVQVRLVLGHDLIRAAGASPRWLQLKSVVVDAGAAASTL